MQRQLYYNGITTSLTESLAHVALQFGTSKYPNNKKHDYYVDRLSDSTRKYVVRDVYIVKKVVRDGQ